jgi:hypothetical protein
MEAAPKSKTGDIRIDIVVCEILGSFTSIDARQRRKETPF